MKKAHALFLFVLSIALYIILWKIVKSIQIDDELITLTSKETRLLLPNTRLYYQMELIDISNGKINTFIFDKQPQLADEAQEISFTKSVALSGFETKYWSRHFNNGSAINLKWNVNDRSAIFVLKGEDSIERWVAGNSKKETWTKSERHSLSYEVKESDTYVVVLENLRNTSLESSIGFNLFCINFDTTLANGFYEGTFRKELLFGEQLYLILENSSDQVFNFQILWMPRNFAFPLFIVTLLIDIIVYNCLNVKTSRFLYYPKRLE